MRNSHRIIDEWLVVNCQRGDREALELLVKRWDSRIVRRIYLTTQDATASKGHCTGGMDHHHQKNQITERPWCIRVVVAKDCYG